MPNDAVYATKPESHCRFDKLTRNVVTHLDDPTKPNLKVNLDILCLLNSVKLFCKSFFYFLLFVVSCGCQQRRPSKVS